MLALGKPRSIGEIIMTPTKPPNAKSHPTPRNERAPYETGFVLSADQSDPNDRPSNVRRLRKSRRFGSGGW
jgi:hypothetical protein